MSREFVTVPMDTLTSLEAYNLLASTVVPRPIAFVSTCNSAGVPNLAPFSFFMVGGANPPSVMYSPTLNKNGEPKDSLRNVLDTGEFVINSVHPEMAEGMNAASFEFESHLSEWDVAGLTPLPSVSVRPPRVLESRVQFECKLFQVVEHGSGPNAARYVIGEILYAHIDKLLAATPENIDTLARLGGAGYLDLAQLLVFDLVRPKQQ